MGLDTNRQRLEFIRRLPLSQRTGATFFQPSKKPKVEGVRTVDPRTGALGSSIFTRDFPGRKFVAIPRTTQLAASFERLASPTEREFAKRQQVVIQQEATKLRIKELERRAKFKTGKAKRQLIVKAKSLKRQSIGELRKQERIQSRLQERRRDIAISTIRTEQESLIKLLQRQGNRVVVNPSTGTIIATDIITGRRKIITPSQIRTTLKGTIGVGGAKIEAAVPKGAKVDVGLIRLRRQRKEEAEELKQKIQRAIDKAEARDKGFVIKKEPPEPKTRAARVTERIAGFVEKRESDLTSFQERVFRKLRLTPNIKERTRLKQSGTFVEKAGRFAIDIAKAVISIEFVKAIGRVPLEFAGLPLVIGGRAAIGTAALFDREKRKIVTGAFKEVPKAAITMHDPREPEGFLQIILTLLAIRGVAASKAKATKLGKDVSNAKVISAEVKVFKPVRGKVTIIKKGVLRVGGKRVAFFEKRVVSQNRVSSILKKGTRVGDFVITKRTLKQITFELKKAKVKPTKKVKVPKIKRRVIVRLKPKARAKLARAKARLAKPLRKARLVFDIRKERVNVQTKRFVRRTQRKLGDLDIQIRFRRFALEQKVKSISSQSIRKVNIKILRIKRIIRLGKEGTTTKVRVQLNTINKILKRFNLRLRIQALRLKGLKAKLAKPISKVGRIVRISGTKLSKVNSNVVTKVRTNLGNLGIKVSFTKFRAKARISNISSGARRNINIKLLRIKRQIRLSRNRITKPILSNINSISNSLKLFNIRMRVLKLRIKEKISIVKPKVIRAIRKPIRISGEVLSQVNTKVIRNVRTTLGNLDIRVKFAKFRVQNRISDISSVASRNINRRIRLIRRGIRLSRNKITKPILSNINSISNSLKLFNIRMRVIKLRIGERISAAKPKVIRAIRRPIRISGKALSNVNNRVITKVRTSLGNLGINVSFTKNRLKVRIRDISSITSRKINRRVLLIRRSLRLSGNKVTRPVISNINSINNSLKLFNIKLRVTKLRVGQVLKESKLIKAPKKVLRKVIRTKRQIFTRINKNLNRVNTSLKTVNIRIKFKTFKIRQRINRLTTPLELKINRNFRVLRRQLINSKGRINKVVRKTIKRINDIIPIDIKVVKIRPIKGKRLLVKRLKARGEIRPGLIRNVEVLRRKIISNLFRQRKAVRIGRPFEFKDILTGKTRIFISRKQFLKAVKQQLKTVRSTQGRQGLIENIVSINRNLRKATKVKKVGTRFQRLQLEKQRRFLRKQQAIERKLARGLQVKSLRGETGIFVGGKEIFPFFDKTLGKFRVPPFTSRKLWLRAVKQQLKTRIAEGLITKPKINLNTLFKPRAVKIKGGFKIIDNRGKVLFEAVKKPRTTQVDLKSGRQTVILKTLEKTKSRTTTKQAEQIPSSQRLVTVLKQKQAVKQVSSTRQVLVLKLKSAQKQVSVSKNQSLAQAVGLFKGLNSLLLGKTKLASVLLGGVSKQAQLVLSKLKSKQAQVSKQAQLSAQAKAQVLSLALVQESLSLQAQLSAQASMLRRILKTKQKLIPKLKLKLVPPIFPDDEEKKKKLRRLAGKVIQSQRFVYLNDLYSAIYDIKANPTERKAFLKVGRVFTGLERRKLVKGRR